MDLASFSTSVSLLDSVVEADEIQGSSCPASDSDDESTICRFLLREDIIAKCMVRGYYCIHKSSLKTLYLQERALLRVGTIIVDSEGEG